MVVWGSYFRGTCGKGKYYFLKIHTIEQLYLILEMNDEMGKISWDLVIFAEVERKKSVYIK